MPTIASLLDPVFDIADNVSVDAAGAHVDLPQKALEALVSTVDRVIFQVRRPAAKSSTASATCRR